MTRLKLKSLQYLIPFVIQNEKINQQIKSSPGFLKGESIVSDNLVGWTKTLWISQQSAEKFSLRGNHGRVIQKISHWSSEAVRTSQQVETDDLPSWQDVTTKLSQTGNFYPLNNPSEHHQKHIIVPPHIIFATFKLLPISSQE